MVPVVVVEDSELLSPTERLPGMEIDEGEVVGQVDALTRRRQESDKDDGEGDAQDGECQRRHPG